LIFRDASGRELADKDQRGVTGKVNYEIVGDAASRMQEAGRRAGAHEVAPTFPYPFYDAAWTYLLLGDTTQAEEKYSEVDKLAARGFSTAKTALACWRREREGEIGTGAYKTLVLLESSSPSEKKQVLSALLEKWPRFGGSGNPRNASTQPTINVGHTGSRKIHTANHWRQASI
jgi:hypothetical protein